MGILREKLKAQGLVDYLHVTTKHVSMYEHVGYDLFYRSIH
jgi:hypothetical protein